MTDDDNIVPFKPRPLPNNDPLFQAAATLLDWVAEMKNEGHCPDAVIEALAVLFHDWPDRPK
jgi:hypothetical protein